MNNRPRAREKERCKLIRKYGYADYYIKFVLPKKQNAEKEGNVAENDLIRRRDVLKLIEDIKCDDGIHKNYGTLLDIMRKIRALPAADALEKTGLLSKREEGKVH